jgi:hypothetical protein
MYDGNSVENSISNKSLKRPLLITIFAGIHLLIGVLYSASVVSGLFYYTFIEPDYSRALPKYILLYFVILLCGSVFGMWKGRPYGWWCTALLYMGMISKIIIEFSISLNIIPLKAPTEGIYLFEYKYLLYVGLLFIYSLVLSIFFRKNILEYFSIEKIVKVRTIGILCVATIAYYFLGQLIIFGSSLN